MVRFEKDKLIIEIEAFRPPEDWLDIMESLIFVLGAINPDYGSVQERANGVITLLESMLPTFEQAMKLAHN
ncbi:MAG: hypothetical protein MdMp024_1886 [Bacteroidales bacterium]